MTRGERLHVLRAFGLYVKGMNFREIGQLFAAEENLPYYASRSGDARTDGYYPAGVRTLVEQGWRLVRHRCPRRWPPAMHEFGFEIRYLKGARYTPPPPRVLTPLEELLEDVRVLEDKARRRGIYTVADGLRNFRAAVAYNARSQQTRRESTA